MVELSRELPVKALDGSVQPLDRAVSISPSPANNGSTEHDLPKRVKQSSMSSKISIPPAGQILTGKQEHCGSSSSHASATNPLTKP